jgi:predicted small secreted protein
MSRTTRQFIASYPLGFLAFAAMVCALMLSGCNTTQGAGKDIEKLGEGIQGAAEGAK